MSARFSSFTSFAGNRSMSASWVWWFILRPPMGAAIALIAYFILRSGLLLDGQLGVQVSPFGIAALGGIIGLFSKQLIDKLRSVADTTFNTTQDENRADMIAYFILRSGLLLDGQLGVQVSPFGIAALGGIIGLFSKQLIDKLRSVADTTFNTTQDENRADKL